MSSLQRRKPTWQALGRLPRASLVARGGRLAMIALSCACSSSPEQAPGGEGRVSSVQSVVDEARGFELASPGSGWRMLGPEAAVHLLPDAVAGALSDEVAAVVVVERMPAVPLERLAERMIDEVVLDGRTVEQRDELRLGDVDAQRFLLSGKRGEVELRFMGLVAARGERAYRLLAWGSKENTSDSGAFAPLVEAFSLRSGEAREAAPTEAADGQGVDWRLSEGVLENAAAGLRVRRAAGWRLLVGRDLDTLDPDADLGMRCETPGMIVLFYSEPCSGASEALESEMAFAFAEALGRKPEPKPVEAKLLGEELSLLRHRDAEREYLHGATVLDGRCLQVLARHAASDRQAAERELAVAMKSVERMDAKAVDALAGELASALEEGTSLMGADFVVRGKVLRHFGRGIRWTAPAGMWRMLAGSRAQGIVGDALAVADNRALGLRAVLLLDDPAYLDAARYHQRVIDGMGARVGFRSKGAAESLPALDGALASSGEASLRGRTLGYRVITRRVDEGLAFQLLVFGRPEALNARVAVIEQLLAGIEVDSTMRAFERTTDSYRDRRLGYEMSLPAEWRQEDRTPVELASLGSFVRWDHGGRWIGMLALSLPGDGAGSSYWVATLEQLIADDIQGIARGDVTAGDDSLAGRPARHLAWQARWQHVDALVMRRGSFGYALVAVDYDGTTFEEARKGFALLP